MTEPRIRSQGGEIIIRGNGQATERHALQREDGIFSQVVARFIEQMAFVRRRPGASTRRWLLFADDRARHREDGIFSQMVARFIEQMAFVRRRPGASTRRWLLFA